MDTGAWRATVMGLQRVGHNRSNLAHMHARLLERTYLEGTPTHQLSVKNTHSSFYSPFSGSSPVLSSLSSDAALSSQH